MEDPKPPLRSRIRNMSITLGDAIWEHQNNISFAAGVAAGVAAMIYYRKNINFPDIEIVTDVSRETLAQEMLEQGYVHAICTCARKNHNIIIAANG